VATGPIFHSSDWFLGNIVSPFNPFKTEKRREKRRGVEKRGEENVGGNDRHSFKKEDKKD
jgi:hypothetical protein